jgi:hypothetical protein
MRNLSPAHYYRVYWRICEMVIAFALPGKPIVFNALITNYNKRWDWNTFVPHKTLYRMTFHLLIMIKTLSHYLRERWMCRRNLHLVIQWGAGPLSLKIMRWIQLCAGPLGPTINFSSSPIDFAFFSKNSYYLKSNTSAQTSKYTKQYVGFPRTPTG